MANDAYQDRKLSQAGWTVLRFWESDLIRNLTACTERLHAAIAGRSE
jgi:very-short-patch-repair endonuclease